MEFPDKTDPHPSDIEITNQSRGKLIPVPRLGTKTFQHVPRHLIDKDFESSSGRYFLNIMPEQVAEDIKRALYETGMHSEEALSFIQYATSNHSGGGPISTIAQQVYKNPTNPRAFARLYGLVDSDRFDIGHIFTTGAHAIYLRLQTLIENLPKVIMDERERLGLSENDPYVILNIGCAYALDTIHAVHENPHLKKCVKVYCIDPDADSLATAKHLASQLDVSSCFEFIPERVEKAIFPAGHMMLFIGMFCNAPTEKAIFVLKLMQKYLADDAIIIFSTVQTEMLMNGPILDFMMWCYGWTMYFKDPEEPAMMVKEAGLFHEKEMDWEDSLGFNRMTVARKTNN